MVSLLLGPVCEERQSQFDRLDGPGLPTGATDSAIFFDPAGVKVTTDFAARHHCVFWTAA